MSLPWDAKQRSACPKPEIYHLAAGDFSAHFLHPSKRNLICVHKQYLKPQRRFEFELTEYFCFN